LEENLARIHHFKRTHGSITTENLPHPQKIPLTISSVPKPHCYISCNYQPPEADFEAISLEQAQLKRVGGEQ